MKFKQTLNCPALWCAMSFAAFVNSPASAEDSGWYFGGNAGLAKANIDDRRLAEDLQNVGLTTTRFYEDDDHFGYKFFTGYQFGRFFAMEGGFFDLGNFNYIALTLPAGTLSEEIKVRGVNLDLLLLLPLTEKLSLFVRGGGNYAESKVSLAGAGAAVVLDPEHEKRDTNYKFGVGFQYSFTPSFGMRAEAERYRIDDAVGNRGDIDLYSAGLVYRFGQHAPATTPEPALPPPQAPVPAPPPPPPPPGDSDNDGVTDDLDKCPGTPPGVAVDANGCPLKGSIILEGVTFEYNSAMLTADSRNTLGTLAAALVKYSRMRVEVQGHTDNVGGDAYNLRLSHRRAATVREYLVGRAVPADRLVARGYGEGDPIDDNQTDAGRARNRRVVLYVIANPGEVRITGEGTVEK
jgi:OOP family OmpA-OmpF porin